MSKFVAGFLFGIITLCSYSLYAQVNNFNMLADTFIEVGGYGSDGLGHKLKVEADGSVHCSP